MQYADKTKRLAAGGLAWGATNSSKTFGNASLFARHCVQTPGLHLLLGNNLRLLRAQAIPLLAALCHHYGAAFKPYNTQTGTLRIGKSAVFVAAASKAGDEERLRSIHNVRSILAEEVAAIPEPAFDMAVSRGQPGGIPVWASCNPAAPTSWVKRRLDAGQWAHAEQFFVKDNPSLDDDQVAQFESQFSGVFYQRMIAGEWAVSEGLVYPHWKHTDATSERGEPFILTLDPAPVNTQAALKIVRRPDHYAVVDEIYVDSGAMQGDAMTLLNRIHATWGEPTLAVIDSAARDVLFAAGVTLGWRVSASQKGHETGVPRLRLLFEQGELRINAATCPHTVAELYSLVYNDRGRLDERIAQHACDALEYVSAVLPPIVPQPEYGVPTFSDRWAAAFRAEAALRGAG